MAIFKNFLVPTLVLGCLTLNMTNAAGAACSVSAGDINFGFPTATTGSTGVVADLVVTCVDGPSNGTMAYSIRINNGQNGNGIERRLRNPIDGSTIRYEIYKDAGHSVVWGGSVGSAAVGTVRFNGAGFSTAISGATRTRAAINAQDFANATVGTYTDKLIMTIEF